MLVVALIAGAWAADVESVVESVSEDFATNEQPAQVVQSLAVALDPTNVVRATIVKHLPSHVDADADAAEDESAHGDAFETSNWEADQVEAGDSLEATSAFVEADADAEVDADADADADAEADAEVDAEEEGEAPSFGPKAGAVKAQAAVDVPDMTRAPLGTPTNANAAVDPTSPAALNAVDKALAAPVMDEAAVRASHLYIGYEDPKALPDGTELTRKIPVDTSGTIGTEAGTAFNYAKGQTPKSKKCANGCQVRLPVMVGYRGVREDPAESTRRVTVPGDRERHRRVHSEFKTGEKWQWLKSDLAAADKHLKGAAWRLQKLKIKRKAYEDTALNREVRVPDNAAGIVV